MSTRQDREDAQNVRYWPTQKALDVLNFDPPYQDFQIQNVPLLRLPMRVDKPRESSSPGNALSSPAVAPGSRVTIHHQLEKESR